LTICDIQQGSAFLANNDNRRHTPWKNKDRFIDQTMNERHNPWINPQTIKVIFSQYPESYVDG
jgi:hypothetical protein